MSTDYLCKKCRTTDKSKFYPSIPSRCKACQKAKSSGCDRRPEVVSQVNCLKCGRLSLNPKADFSISKQTGLYLDKCNTCKYSSPHPGENSPQRIQPLKGAIVPITQIIAALNLQRHQQLYQWAKDTIKPSKADIKILIDVFKQLDQESE